MRKRGCIEPVVYFVAHHCPKGHPEGYIMLAPYSSYPTPEGYSYHEADTLAAVDVLQSRLQEQEAREWEAERTMDEAQFHARRQKVRDSLYARMTSGSTGQYEKDFIREWLKLRSEKRRRYSDAFEHRHAYLYAREFDTPGRRADEERAPSNIDVVAG